MSRKPNTEQRRAQIVQALLDTMAEHGYEKATIQLIARRAELTPGLLHYYFHSKADILLALVKALAAAAQQRYFAFAQNAADADQRLKAYIDARLGLGEGADPGAVAAWVVIGAEAVRQPEVRAAYQHAIDTEMTLLRELLSASLAAHGKSTANVHALAAALLAMMEGTFQLASAAQASMPTGYAAPMATQLVRRFIDAEPPA
ncbi:TetR/AcrR family transcriptional regulator [Massilia sp. P8910]|uniref:TetR/AcrR family transcriptional regulator n=1 Tax=Massilia antarctica TaxID=2765360 RepID=UPI001E5D5737|nr:TetR family transcriptional regulator [Massilia antarctica]MCE3605955.1 TetR/AcrR family transcriptional regulator [Massilia antarctica]